MWSHRHEQRICLLKDLDQSGFGYDHEILCLQIFKYTLNPQSSLRSYLTPSLISSPYFPARQCCIVYLCSSKAGKRPPNNCSYKHLRLTKAGIASCRGGQTSCRREVILWADMYTSLKILHPVRMLLSTQEPHCEDTFIMCTLRKKQWLLHLLPSIVLFSSSMTLLLNKNWNELNDIADQAPSHLPLIHSLSSLKDSLSITDVLALS